MPSSDTQFKKGKSGNPQGKPIGSRSFTTKVREALEKIADGKDYTYEEAFIKAILKKSIVDQDVGMMRTVWEQLDGKPLQRMANADGSNLIDITDMDTKIDSLLLKYGRQAAQDAGNKEESKPKH